MDYTANPLFSKHDYDNTLIVNTYLAEHLIENLNYGSLLTEIPEWSALHATEWKKIIDSCWQTELPALSDFNWNRNKS